MSENLVSRVMRLVSGGVNNIVDAVEDASPELVMKEAIREIDAAIDQVRDEMGRVVANKHLANTRLLESNTRHEDLMENIALAVQQGRDDLATAAVARQLDLEAQIPILENAIKDASAEEAELEGFIAALQARKREMEGELESFQASRSAGGEGSGAAPKPSPAVEAGRAAEKAEGAFNRAIRGASGLPGGPASDPQSAAHLAELEKLTRDHRVQERLAAIKAAHKKAE